MIKKMNKATSLLIATAAVISLMPATGVSAAEKLQTKEGTIETAIAFDGGKYIYDGYKTEEDTDGVYYNSGDKDKLLEDLNADSMTKFGDKYASVIDGSDEYLVDLSTGKVEEDTAEDRRDSIKTKLKSTLSKTDRYGNVDSTDKVTLDDVSKEQFGTNWYSYKATGATASHSGYVSDTGKYIDADLTANIYVSNGTKMIKIEKFGEENTDYKIKVDLVSATTIAEDNDFIYRTVNVKATNTATSETTTATYIQKISKAQGEQEDDAYLPNTVDSYQVSSAYDSDDADDAAKTITDAIAQDANTREFRVINGVLYNTKNDGQTVTVTTINLKKDKVALKDTSNKLDVYLAEQDVQEDQDITKKESVSIDADGNTWAIDKGNIVKFDGNDFTDVYTCDSGLDTLEVYDKDSLIAWEDGESIYTTIGTGTTETPVETPVTTPVVNKGWINTATGWTFFDTTGKQAKGQWVSDGGTWYMLKADGIMATGWYNDNGTWYFLQSSGAMKTGWLNDGGTWYYLNTSGSMAANTTIDGYKLNASGAWIK